MTPWFKGFNGEIEPKEDDISYTVKGKFNVIRDGVLITELPIRTWTRSYKTYLEEFFKDE
jgi:DNA topoisomerase-2